MLKFGNRTLQTTFVERLPAVLILCNRVGIHADELLEHGGVALDDALLRDHDALLEVGFRNFSIRQIRLEISRNFTEISVQSNRKGTFHYLMVAQFK